MKAKITRKTCHLRTNSVLFLVIALLTFNIGAFAQEELRIHQINVEDGDATMIGIFNTVTGKYKNMVLIDGGNVDGKTYLLPYLQKATNTVIPKFDYVALTHYHQDHYKGLLIIGDGKIKADTVIDPAGYPLSDVFPDEASVVTSEVKPSAMEIAEKWTTALKKAVSNGFVKGHSMTFLSFGATPQSGLKRRVTIGTVDNIPVVLECIGGWGDTPNGNGSITANPSPSKSNANNFTIGFILSFGEFRYFIGGDMGGTDESSYIDQETSLTAYLGKEYPESWSFNHITKSPGHLCGFKANHHGSQYSNTDLFMDSMTPAITFVSAGNNASWHLPNKNFLKRLSDVKPLSVWTSTGNNVYNRGVYVTNLYDFPNHNSQTTANSLFSNKPLLSYSYGNKFSGAKASYLIKVKSVDIQSKSSFQVFQIGQTGNETFLATFLCHSK